MTMVNPMRKKKEIPKITIKAVSTPVTKLDALVEDDKMYIAFICYNNPKM
jgi:hypothetical protein